jgi:hypothetical protein
MLVSVKSLFSMVDHGEVDQRDGPPINGRPLNRSTRGEKLI